MLPFFWLYPLCETDWGRAVAVFGQAALALALALSLMMLRFWRDPERLPPEGEGIVLSAADGKVLYVRAIKAHFGPGNQLPAVRMKRRKLGLTSMEQKYQYITQ